MSFTAQALWDATGGRARRWLARLWALDRREAGLDAAALSGGVVVGLSVTFLLLWIRARSDVASFLANPPRPPASVVWSAPMSVRAGMQVDVEAIAADLLAAGFDRVEAPMAPADGSAGQFSVRSTDTPPKTTIDVWSAEWTGPTGNVPAGHAVVEIRGGKVVRTTPKGEVVLRPTVLGTIGDPETQRTPVRMSGLSPWIEPALLAMEDERFRTHGGVDPLGIVRALIAVGVHGSMQGGSTLTQQLAKNLFLTSERTVRRKVREVFFAAALESQLDKDQLLELYLSEIYLGQMGGMPLYGVDAAARAWFGLSAQKLDLVQTATIIGVIPAPNAWSPVRNPDGARERRNLVLRKLAEDGTISAEELATAQETPLSLRGLEPSRVRRAPYAFDLAVDLAEQRIGSSSTSGQRDSPESFGQGGYTLYTAIDPILQLAAENAISAGMHELQAANPTVEGIQAALVAVRLSDGAVVALVGGRSYADSPFNRARDAHRQVGSTVKPFTMLAAFERGLATPATMLDDAPITRNVGGEAWTPRNYDGTYLGPVTLREAIETSRNIPAVLLSERVGHGALAKWLREVGLPDATALPSAALGSFPATPLELAGAYTVFDRGIVVKPRVLLAVDDPVGETVATFPVESTTVVSAEVAAVAVHVLEGVITSGTGARAASYGLGPPVAGKTGTTDEYRDAWFVGLTREWAVAVWVGKDEGILGLSGAKAALPTWARFVAAAAPSKDPRPRPAGVVEAQVCSESGGLARQGCSIQYPEWFVVGEAPEPCELHGFQLDNMFDWLFPKRRGSESEGDRAPFGKRRKR